MDKPGSWFLLAKCLKNTCDIYVKMQVDDVHLYLKCYSSKGDSKNQQPDFHKSGILVDNGLIWSEDI